MSLLFPHLHLRHPFFFMSGNKTMGHAFALPRSFYSPLRFADLVLGWVVGVQRTAKRMRPAEEALRMATEHLDVVRSGFMHMVYCLVFVSVVSYALINVLSNTLVPLRLLRCIGVVPADRN
jgi:hypothetical protein